MRLSCSPDHVLFGPLDLLSQIVPTTWTAPTPALLLLLPREGRSETSSLSWDQAATNC